MLIYIFYYFIISSFLKILNINNIVYIISLLFFDSKNRLFLLGIFLGIICSNIFKIIKNKTKFSKNMIIFILIEIIKISFFKSYPLLIIISVFLSFFLMFIKNNIKNNKFLIVLYVLLPLSSIFIYRIYYQDDKEAYLYITTLPTYIIIHLRINLFSVSIKSLIGFIIIFLVSLYMEKISNKDIKKRNIFMIFLILIIFIYYKYIC